MQAIWEDGEEKIVDDLVKDFYDGLKSLPDYIIAIGIQVDASGRKEKIQIGITNAALMYIHENGSPAQHIPARPVLQMTIDWASENLFNKTIDKALKQYVAAGFKEEAFDLEVQKLCIRMENYARKLIYSNDGRLAPNAPSTIRAKGDNHPLFDTGQLARSITCRFIKKERK